MPTADPSGQRPTIADRGFGGDDGAVDVAVAEALRLYASDQGGYAVALHALASSRLLLPVVSVDADQLPPHPHAHGSDAAGHHGDPDHAGRDHAGEVMAAVSIQRPDGRKGMLAFTSLESQARWDPATRPLPVSAAQAAETALGDGATALVIDIAGPVRFVIEGEDLVGVANQWSLGRVGDRSVWIRPSSE